jgi:hypothetical protein
VTSRHILNAGNAAAVTALKARLAAICNNGTATLRSFHFAGKP